MAIAGVLLSAPACGLGLLTDDRQVTETFRPDLFTPVTVTILTPDVPFGPFRGVFQDSSMTLSQDGLVLTGTALGSGSLRTFADAFDRVRSFFRITFRIDGNATIALSGSITAYPYGVGSVSLQGIETIYYASVGGPEVAPVDFTGTLPSGQYTLEAQADGFVNGGGGNFDFSFEVRDSAVPEPATALLVAAGLACLRGSRGSLRSAPLRRPRMGTDP